MLPTSFMGKYADRARGAVSVDPHDVVNAGGVSVAAAATACHRSQLLGASAAPAYMASRSREKK